MGFGKQRLRMKVSTPVKPVKKVKKKVKVKSEKVEKAVKDVKAIYDNIKRLRDKYQELYGKRPFMGWDANTLMMKIREKS